MLEIDLLNVISEKQCRNVQILICFIAIKGKYNNTAAILAANLDFGGHVEFEIGVWFDFCSYTSKLFTRIRI